MSSTATITTSPSFGLRRITAFNRKNPWPEPHLSIGECWCIIGQNRCWEAIGPAKEKYDEVSGNIKNLLESQHEYLTEGICVRRFLIFDLYMIGRTEEQAKPTIIFSSENKTQRQRAQKLVRDSGILNACPGMALGESSRPLRLSNGPRPLGDQLSNDDIEMSDDVDSSTVPEAHVYYSQQPVDIYGIPITIKKAGTGKSRGDRKSTLNLVCIGEELFGLTAAHAFFDDPDDEKSTVDDIMEFSLEDEDQDVDAPEDVDEFVDMTSRGESGGIIPCGEDESDG
jgi:hypothetical protein